MRHQSDFPVDIGKHVWQVYPRKGIVVVDGFKRFTLKNLKKIPLNTRLSFPHDLFVAIHQS